MPLLHVMLFINGAIKVLHSRKSIFMSITHDKCPCIYSQLFSIVYTYVTSVLIFFIVEVLERHRSMIEEELDRGQERHNMLV